MNGLWKLAVPLIALAMAPIACGDGDEDDEGSLSASPEATVLGANTGPEEGSGSGDTCERQTYEVQSGDTLSEIALTFDVSVEAIAGASGIGDLNVLEIGQELTIPCPGQLPGTPQATDGAEASPSPAP